MGRCTERRGTRHSVTLTPVVAALAALAAIASPALGQEADCSDAAGTWDLTMTFQGQSVQPTMVLEQSECEVSGTLEGQQGSLAFEDGKVEGTRLTFTISIDAPSGETIALTVDGEMEADEMTGTLTTPQGTVEFTGKRRQG